MSPQAMAIKKGDWSTYFDFLSRVTRGRQILLEQIGEEIGDQIEENWTFFEGFYFDYDANTLYVCTPFTEHPIYGPESVMIQEQGLIRSIGIRDSEGRLQIIHFRDPALIGHATYL